MAQSKSVVITGATGGVGVRIVDRFLRDGWRVFAAARRPGAIGRDGVVGQVDLESSDSVAAAAETIIAQLGSHGLDALINCAGVLVDSPVELIPDDELRVRGQCHRADQLDATSASVPARCARPDRQHRRYLRSNYAAVLWCGRRNEVRIGVVQ